MTKRKANPSGSGTGRQESNKRSKTNIISEYNTRGKAKRKIESHKHDPNDTESEAAECDLGIASKSPPHSVSTGTTTVKYLEPSDNRGSLDLLSFIASAELSGTLPWLATVVNSRCWQWVNVKIRDYESRGAKDLGDQLAEEMWKNWDRNVDHFDRLGEEGFEAAFTLQEISRQLPFTS